MSCSVDLFWIPVGAGTPRLQRLSLRCWEAIEATRAHRAQALLVHAGLKMRTRDRQYTVELTPAFVAAPGPPAMSGPVGVRGADRFRLFRYQLVCRSNTELPDERWAVGDPIRLTESCEITSRILSLLKDVPPNVWGRRVAGTDEMWTSDSVASWLLVKSGVDVSRVFPPAGTRAPGWSAGVAIAKAGPGRSSP